MSCNTELYHTSILFFNRLYFLIREKEKVEITPKPSYALKVNPICQFCVLSILIKIVQEMNINGTNLVMMK